MLEYIIKQNKMVLRVVFTRLWEPDESQFPMKWKIFKVLTYVLCQPDKATFPPSHVFGRTNSISPQLYSLWIPVVLLLFVCNDFAISSITSIDFHGTL